jgi:hypothetical protein
MDELVAAALVIAERQDSFESGGPVLYAAIERKDSAATSGWRWFALMGRGYLAVERSSLHAATRQGREGNELFTSLLLEHVLATRRLPDPLRRTMSIAR